MRQLSITLLIIALNITYSVAQKQMSLSQCITLGLSNSNTIANAKLDIAQATTQIDIAKSNYIPDVTIGASQRFNFGRSIDQFTNDYISQVYNTTFVFADLNMPIYRGFRTFNQIKSAQYQHSAQEQNLLATQNILTLQIAEAYYAVLSAKEIANTAITQLNTAQDQYLRQAELFKSGLSNKLQLLQFENIVKQEQINTITSDNAVKVSKLNLLNLMNVPYEEDLEITTIDDVEASAMASFKVDGSSIEKLPQFENLRQRQLALDHTIKVTQSQQMPSLSFGASYGTFFASSNNSRTFLQQFNDTRNGNVGLNLSIPIGRNFSVKPQVASIKMQQQQLINEKTLVTTTLRNQVANSQMMYTNAKDQYLSLVDQVNITKEVLDLTQKSLSSGTVSVNDIFIARNNYNVAQSSLIQAKYRMKLHSDIISFYQNGRFP